MRLTTAVRCLVVALVTVCATAEAGTICVSTAGSDANDGLSWPAAKQTVQAGLNAAAAGDQVWVAAGTYVENITLKAEVALYGGFAGGETALEQRDWSANVTILDGNQGARVVTAPDGATETTRIDGFAIHNGSANGGIYCANCSPTIANNTISGTRNTGIDCRSASPTIINNTISGKGAGIGCRSSSPVILNNTISGNYVAIHCYSEGSPTIASNTIADNYDGIMCSDRCSPIISNNTITGCNDYYGGIYCENDCTPLIANNIIANNISNHGGIYCGNCSATILNNTIVGNDASLYYPPAGGGIYCSGSAIIANNTIMGNTASHNGAGVYLESCVPATLINNTITTNSGTGIHARNSATLVVNCIVAFNSFGIDIAEETGTPTLRNNCIYGNRESNYTSVTDATGTNGNISVDPKLAGASYHNAHIQPDSPCIDAGDDSAVQSDWLDRDGQPRILGTHVDIGVDESDGTVWPAAPDKIIRVSPQGNDTNDGSSWALAKRTVQAAIDAIAVTPGDVWVAEGTYVERITLRKYAHVYGGFSGTETERSARDFKKHVTILDGNQAGSVVIATDIPYLFGTIDGFTIWNGKASSGGGIFCSGGAPMISNNTITGNTATSGGGGIYALESSPTIAGNTITANTALFFGGIVFDYPGSAMISNNTITGNTGGAIDCWDGGRLTITDNTITGNTSSNSGGAVRIDWCRSAVIANNTIADNTGGSGAIYCRTDGMKITGNSIAGNSGAGVYAESGSVTITDNIIMGNGGNGGIYCKASGLIANNTIMGNIASTGGGIYCSTSPTIVNNVIAGNMTFLGWSDTYGAGIYCAASSSPTIVNNTVAANISPYSHGAGIYCVATASPTIVNTIVAFNSSGIYKESGTGVPLLRSNCAYGNTTGDYFGLADPTGTNGNISADPKLGDLSYRNVHIQPDSPCRDAGEDSAVQAGWKDLDSQVRVAGTHVDIGADESDGKTWSTGPNVIVHVAPDGSDASDGSSWQLAKRSIQAGIDAAAAAGGEVWVKAGTYVERITVHAYTYLYGGFAGTESQRSSRDWTRNVTVLDGDQAGSVVRAEYIPSWLATIDGFTIRNGNSQYAGGGIDCWQASLTIENNVITDNTASTSGGGIWCADYIVVRNNTITRNTASDNGGGIYCYDHVLVTGNTIAGNSATSGGGICCAAFAPTVADNLILCNTANKGGGIYYLGYLGGTGYSPGSYPTILNNTIIANSASTSGGAMYASPTRLSTIAGTIIAFNSSGLYTDYPDNLSLQQNCVYGNAGYNYANRYGTMFDPTGTTGNISADPLLVRLPDPGSDATWGTADDDYGDLHLLSGSPCVNAGDPAYVPTAGETDFDGQSRVLYGRLDIGADEYRLAGDCNYDGFINVGDLQVLVPCWGSSRVAGGSYSAAADLNGDGYVNVGDLQLLVAGWGKSLQ